MHTNGCCTWVHKMYLHIDMKSPKPKVEGSSPPSKLAR